MINDSMEYVSQTFGHPYFFDLTCIYVAQINSSWASSPFIKPTTYINPRTLPDIHVFPNITRKGIF
jgi:hypothetical protein